MCCLRNRLYHFGADADIVGHANNESCRNKRSAVSACADDCAQRAVLFHPESDISRVLFTAGRTRLFLDDWITLLFVVPLVLIFHYGVVLREERYLAAKFGVPYLQYKREVRHWI